MDFSLHIVIHLVLSPPWSGFYYPDRYQEQKVFARRKLYSRLLYLYITWNKLTQDYLLKDICKEQVSTVCQKGNILGDFPFKTHPFFPIVQLVRNALFKQEV